MSKIKNLLSCLFSSSFVLVLVPGLADKSAPTSSNEVVHNNSMGVLEIAIIICIGVAGVAAISVLLFKLWQRKKREEQQARLLKLFEEDDQLEQELGIN